MGLFAQAYFRKSGDVACHELLADDRRVSIHINMDQPALVYGVLEHYGYYPTDIAGGTLWCVRPLPIISFVGYQRGVPTFWHRVGGIDYYPTLSQIVVYYRLTTLPDVGCNFAFVDQYGRSILVPDQQCAGTRQHLTEEPPIQSREALPTITSSDVDMRTSYRVQRQVSERPRAPNPRESAIESFEPRSRYRETACAAAVSMGPC